VIAKLEQRTEDDQRLAEEKLKTLQAAKLEMEETFKGIAAQVLQQNTEKFEASTKLRLEELLQPLNIST
jgi:DNA anti-recombination protein RmuC